MSNYLTGTPAEMRAARHALATAEGLPRRGVVFKDGVERPDLTAKLVPTEYTPGARGWTDNAVGPAIEVGNEAALEVPEAYQRHLGTRGLPRLADARDTQRLSPALSEAIRQRREPVDPMSKASTRTT